ncbi:MAG: PhoH family protein, partial [Clostridia bacterium]|nr:PhoH family protein [Clostridia bacterium]
MEKVLEISAVEKLISIFGEYDKNINIIKKEFGVSILNRNNTVKIIGDESAVLRAEKAIKSLEKILDSGEEISDVNLGYAIDMAKDDIDDASLYGKDCILITAKGKPLKSKTLGQKNYVEAIEKNTITFGIGPAGTGKTYLAVALAVKAFKNKEI